MLTKFGRSAQMVGMADPSPIEAAFSDPQSPLDIVDVQKLLRYFGFHSIHTESSFTFSNLKEDVIFQVCVSVWREQPHPVVVHLQRDVMAWLAERRAAGLPPYEIDEASFERLLALDAILRRRMRRYLR